MPRFFFHIHKGSDTAIDPDGTELETLEDATTEAIEDHLLFAVEALRRRQPLPYYYTIEICSGEGRSLVHVPFAKAIDALKEMGRAT